jgi:Signal transduction histidine kinase
MGPGLQKDSPDSINTLNKKLRRMWILFVAFHILSLCVMIFATEFGNYRFKKGLASSFIDTAYNSIVTKDYRRVSEVLSTGINNDFTTIHFVDESMNKDIRLVRETTARPKFTFKIPIYFDASEKQRLGVVTFTYTLFDFFKEIALASTFLFLVSLWWINIFRRNMQKDYEKQLAFNLGMQKSEIARKVAHDIRSPLSALNVLIAKHGDVSVDEKSIVKQVIARINQIADDLIRDSGSQSTKPAAKSRTAVTNPIGPALESLITEKKLEYANQKNVQISFRANGLDTNTEISMDETSLLRIVSNLINNSVEAIIEDGTIIIESVPNDNYLIIAITDFGKGLAPETLESFRRGEFKSVGKETSSKSGSGIGLKAANDEIKKSGGTLEIESKQNIGTRITIRIPKIS